MSAPLPRSLDLYDPGDNAGITGSVAPTHSRTLVDPNACPYLGGSSIPAQALRAAVGQLARADVDILLHGEPGSGKCFIAHAVAFETRRAGVSTAMQIVDGRHPGQLEAAIATDSGVPPMTTLYVRNVDALAPELQREFARKMREHRAPHARVIASVESNPTNAKPLQLDPVLDQLLGVVRLCVPPLRHRKEDISSIAQRWRSRRLAREADAPTIDKAAIAALRRWTWPGNVAELLDVLDQAADTGGGHLTAERMQNLVPKVGETPMVGDVLPLAQIELSYIHTVVERCGNNHTRAAALLGIGRSTLIRKLKLRGVE